MFSSTFRVPFSFFDVSGFFSRTLTENLLISSSTNVRHCGSVRDDVEKFVIQLLRAARASRAIFLSNLFTIIGIFLRVFAVVRTLPVWRDPQQ